MAASIAFFAVALAFTVLRTSGSSGSGISTSARQVEQLRLDDGPVFEPVAAAAQEQPNGDVEARQRDVGQQR